ANRRIVRGQGQLARGDGRHAGSGRSALYAGASPRSGRRHAALLLHRLIRQGGPPFLGLGDNLWTQIVL
ncbi:MAG: hypothetical protein ACK55Z_30940, partial [bacterium]